MVGLISNNGTRDCVCYNIQGTKTCDSALESSYKPNKSIQIKFNYI